MKMDDCVVDVEDQEAKLLRVRFCPKLRRFLVIQIDGVFSSSFYSQIWLANHDNEVEGEWINWYTGKVKYPI